MPSSFEKQAVIVVAASTLLSAALLFQILNGRRETVVTDHLTSSPEQYADEISGITNPNQELLKVATNDTSEDLWARALWFSIPANEASNDKVTILFTEALSRSKNKAPIYVSFGDSDSGPNRIKEIFEQVTQALEKDVISEFAVELKKKANNLDDNDHDAAAKLLEQIFENSFRKAIKKESLKTNMIELSEVIKSGTEATILYYLAATAEDPKYKPAWFRLAKLAEGDLKSRAIAQLMKYDANNAMPYYMRAKTEITQNRITTALKSVQRGNGQNECRIYLSPRPKKFTLRYPDNEFFEKFGVIGKPVSASSLAYLLKVFDDLFTWSDPLAGELRELSRALKDEGTRLRKAEQFDDATQYLEAVRDMGFRLKRVTPRDSNIMVTGLGISGIPRDELKKVYQATRNNSKLGILEQTEKARQIFREEFLKSLEKGKLSEAEWKPVLLGKRDPLAEEQQRLEGALIKSGILTLFSEKKP